MSDIDTVLEGAFCDVHDAGVGMGRTVAVALVKDVAATPYFAHRLALQDASGEDCRALLAAILDALETGKVPR